MSRVHRSEEQQAALRRRARSRETAPRTRDRLERVRLADAGWSIPRIARPQSHRPPLRSSQIRRLTPPSRLEQLMGPEPTADEADEVEGALGTA